MNKESLTQTVRFSDSVLQSVLSHRMPAKAIVVDLSQWESYEYQIPHAYLEKYGGGSSLAVRLWADFAGYSVDDSSCAEVENPIVIVPSIIGSSGMSFGNLTCIAFRSPATCNLMINSFKASFDLGSYTAMVIIGRFEHLGLIQLEQELSFARCDELKYAPASEVREIYPNAIICGEAGERKIPYSSCVYQHELTGRGGLGYVFGLKNLKAVVLPVLQAESGKFDKLNAVLNSSDASKDFSMHLLDSAEKSGWAPINNFSKRTDPRLFHLSTIEAEKKLGNCDNLAPYDARLMLGPNSATFDIVKIQERFEFCLEKGLDPISLGNILGWVIEAQNQGIVSFSGKIDFTDNERVIKLLSTLVKREGEGACLSYGLQDVSSRFGGESFAYQINNLECGSFDYRGNFAQALNDALGNTFPVYFALKDGLITSDHACWVFFNEQLVLGLQSMGVNPDIIYPLLIEHSALRKSVCKLPFISMKKAFSSDVLISSLSKACGTDIDFSTLLVLGYNCMSLIRAVNSNLKVSSPAIPDYFCIEPESNHKDANIVPFRILCSEYSDLMEQFSNPKVKN